MAIKRKSSSKRRTIKPSFRNKLMSHTVILPVIFVVMFGLTGVYALTASHAARSNYHYFWAYGGIYSGPSTKSLWYGEISPGWHAVIEQNWCPNRPDSYVKSGSYHNDWWTQLVYHNKGYVNNIALSGGGNSDGNGSARPGDGTVPGVPAFYDCPTTLF